MHKSCRTVEIRRLRGKESGFLLTLELLLLLTIFSTVIYFGMQLWQQYLVKNADPFGGHTVRVYDKGGTSTTAADLVGVAESFTTNETPLLVYRPYAAGTGPGPVAALLGAHPDRFSTHTRVYYNLAACNANSTAYLGDPNQNLAMQTLGEPISELYALQGVAFGVGKFGDPPAGDDALYNTANVPPASLTHLLGNVMCGPYVQATGHVNPGDIGAGSVLVVTIDNPGSGYTTPPTVTFTPNCGDTPATPATASTTINGSGQVTSVTVTNAGANGTYTCPPTVTFSAPVPQVGELQSYYDSESKSCSSVTCNVSNLLAIHVTPAVFSTDITTLFPPDYWTPAAVSTATPVPTVGSGSLSTIPGLPEGKQPQPALSGTGHVPSGTEGQQ